MGPDVIWCSGLAYGCRAVYGGGIGVSGGDHPDAAPFSTLRSNVTITNVVARDNLAMQGGTYVRHETLASHSTLTVACAVGGPVNVCVCVCQGALASTHGLR